MKVQWLGDASLCKYCLGRFSTPRPTDYCKPCSIELGLEWDKTNTWAYVIKKNIFTKIRYYNLWKERNSNGNA